MSVNAATINQQILTQQFVTQQTAEQTSSTQKDNKSTTWKPEGMPSGLTPSQQVNYAGQELYLYVDAIANSPSGVPNTDQTAGLAYFINQFVTACNTATSATPPVVLNSSTQTLYNDLTVTKYTVIINGQTENESLETLSQQILKGGVSGYQSLIAMQNLFHNGLGHGADPWSPTEKFENDLNAWEANNPNNYSGPGFYNAGSSGPNYNNSNNPSGDNDLQALAYQWSQTASNLTNPYPNPNDPGQETNLEILAQDIVNVNDDLNSMQKSNSTLGLSPALQLLSYALNAPVYDGTSMVTLATNVVTDMDSGSANLDTALSLFDNAYQTENAYIGQFINEANNPGGYGQIPT